MSNSNWAFVKTDFTTPLPMPSRVNVDVKYLLVPWPG